MKTTAYFEEQVLRKRPYILREWCERALREPVYLERNQMAESAIGFLSQNWENTYGWLHWMMGKPF